MASDAVPAVPGFAQLMESAARLDQRLHGFGGYGRGIELDYHFLVTEALCHRFGIQAELQHGLYARARGLDADDEDR